MSKLDRIPAGLSQEPSSTPGRFTPPQNDGEAWNLEHLRQLIGYTVTSIGCEAADGDYTYEDEYCLVMESQQPTTTRKPPLLVWILCDPEGNGPGHLSIEQKP
jgi:hypothetical protein